MLCQNCGGNNDVINFYKGAERMVLCADCRMKLLAPGIQVTESHWSNNACLGYVILGAQQIGYSQKQIKQLVRAVYSEFDQTSIEEAKAVYELSPY